jgi:tRNA(Ile)-lysidine synthase
VSFAAQDLLHRLEGLQHTAGKPARYVVAFSGGLDSSVLLHALVSGRAAGGPPILAVHINHGLHADAAAWRDQCAVLASRLGAEFVSRDVVVDTASGSGLEAAAREARYAAFRGLLEPGDWLLSAHHQDDQAETVLLHLMRGSGPAGMAGIRPARRFASGWLLRPLLDVPREELESYARSHEIEYIADPANLDPQFDRNYLRHELLPRFESRWPGAATAIRRSAQLAREAATLLSALADIDRSQLGPRPDRLAVAGLAELSEARQRNVLRHAILQLGLPMPGAVHLEKIVHELVPARQDGQPLVAWPGAEARRYRNNLYLLPAQEPVPLQLVQKVTGERIVLPASLGELRFERGAARGLSEALMRRGLELRFRSGGERFMPVGHRHTKVLKKLLQEEGVVPWMREQLPLLYAGDALVAVADLWMAADAVTEPGTAIRWCNRPPLH